MENNNVIDVAHVAKCFGAKQAVKDVSFTVHKGEVFGLLGPNGAGKTTILRMITTLLRQDAGRITVNGFDTLTQARQARQQFGLTAQAASVDQDLSARENLQIFGRLNGLAKQAAKARATELLGAFDLVQSADQKLAQFSGGMRRRLDLAVSLIGDPPLLFLDEPTTGLDPRTRHQLWQVIRKLVAAGSTVVLTTQYLEEADQLADRIALIDHGQLVALGTPAMLKRRIGGARLRIDLAGSKVDQAAAIVQALAGPVTRADGSLTVALADAQTAITILTKLQAAGITPTHFATEEPSLDEVFLQETVGKN